MKRNLGLTDVGIGTITMSQFHVIESHNHDERRFDIAYVGIVSGSGSIQSIPEENLFTDSYAVIEKGGYVLRGTGSENQGKYARLYVDHFFKNDEGEIIGAEVKYQYPFIP